MDLRNYEQRIINQAHGEFPSYAHEVAWLIAEEYQEPYGFWVRNVLYARMNPGQIKHELEELRPKNFTRRQKAKMLMAKIKPFIHKKT